MKYFERRRYNEIYEETGNPNILNGYRQEDYRSIPDYHTVVHLLRTLPLESGVTIMDVGCGSGLLLKFIQETLLEDPGIHVVPSGCDYNPTAIQVLKEEVFPHHHQRFTVEDVDTLDRPIDADVVLLMHGDYAWNQLTITSPYLILRIREHLEDHPMAPEKKKPILEANERILETRRLKLLAQKASTYRHSFRLYENLHNEEPFY